MPEPAGTTACTIVARNYVPAARVLARSYLEHHPGDGFVIAVIDAPRDEVTELDDGIRVVGPAAFGIDEDDYLRMATAYSVTELATSVKPYLLRELLKTSGVAMYIDPDIELFAPIPEVTGLAREHDIVLVPHFLTPLPQDGLEPDDAVIMGTGIFNLGFIGVGQGAGAFLDFWAGRLRHDAIVAPEQQLFTDQRWVDQVPALFRNHVVTDPGFDVAYWNLHERPIARGEDGTLTAGGAKLRFFHFSGYRPEKPWLLSFHCARKPRVLLSHNADLRAICDSYGAKLREAGYAETLDSIPYGFKNFRDGTEVPKLARRVFREGWIKAERKDRPVPPHAYGEDGGQALREWLATPEDQAQAAAGLNRLTHAIWASRIDLQMAFPHPYGADAENFRFWCAGSGVSEAGLPEWALPAERPASHPPSDEFGVNLLGYLTAELGLGEMGRIVLEAIETGGVPVASVLEEKAVSNRTGIERPATVGDPRFPLSVLAVNADQTRVILTNHPEVGAGRYRIGLWAWELEDFPEWQHEAFGMLDEVWTVSEFCRRAIAAHSPIPVKTIPVPVRDPGEPSPPAREQGEPVRFLFAFDFNSVAERKNPWGAVEAFRRAFPGRDDVRLTIKAINSKLHPNAAERLRATVLGDDRVELIERYLSVAELHELYERSTCYVSLHRSEGFGLTVAEAMARAMPVISTNYSSTTEFLDASTGWPVPYHLVPVGKDNYPYHADAVWADPDLDAAATAMRQVADDPAEAAKRGQAARAYILRERSMATAAEWMRRELEHAYGVWQSGRHAGQPVPAHPISPLQEASQALHWRPEPDTPSRIPLAPALRKAVLRAIDHYDVHQRKVMGALLAGAEESNRRLLERIESLENSLADTRRVADSSRGLAERIEGLRGTVEDLRRRGPDTDLALRNLEADVAKLSDGYGGVGAELEAASASVHKMFAARDERLDADEKAIQRVTLDVGAMGDAARLAHAPVPHGADVVPCDVGSLLMPVDEVMLPWIVFHRSWEDSEAELMARLADGAFLDVGAHVGYHTLRLLRATPDVTRVVAVEADPVNAAYLRRNVEVNLPRAAAELVTVVESAAWDSPGTVRLTQASEGNSGDNRVSTEGPGLEVPAVRLDSLPEVTAQRIGLVKVDLQGRDHRALAGLDEVLGRDRPHVVCEFDPEAIRELGDDPAAVLAGYRTLGYDVRIVEDSGPSAAEPGDVDLIAAARADKKQFLTLWLSPQN
ncbi:FkbM family methyltransferase [Amycolatopsis sp. FDAARGOS 1241]|uniref:FkbM family methyltransferase n=1 Tax=Amycolatopsis sp. FDAARGOS 1241 TaxID=2778070 RepID=UPI0019512A61|nr:FkbM family methyltransferase [Amycolatopsis sp. FDAARGOS 1241]QRP45926.1 FkbM family methyltransferase [Amycolatopsis sp. FDAARGOS 1241]